MRISSLALLLVVIGCGHGSSGGDHPGGGHGGGGAGGHGGGGSGGDSDGGVAMRNPPSPDARLSRFVNTLRGSNSDVGYSRGNTFPGVTVPFGFNFFTPITQANSRSWLYAYRDHQISGFSVSHEPSPWIADHGTLQIMPMTGALQADPTQRASNFNHAHETAQAHYYRVYLDDYGVNVEVSP